MFRQVAVAEQDWDLQQILWRNDPSESLRTYRLVTVTYGTKPASFMTTQCLVTLAQQAYEHFPRAADAITKDFYMDDLMTGGETEAECIKLYQEITSILASAKLPLRKWCSNSSYVLGHIGKNVRDPLFTLELGDEEMVKSLGLCWNPVLDELRSLESQRELNLKSKLKSLRPFIKDGLILVGGRLNNSGLSMLQRHPIVLPANHKVTRLIFERIHLEQLHCGPQALLAEVRRRYWPLTL